MSRRHFFLVGAQRSGTTYLYRLLDAHPEIEMARPVRPEPKFFLAEDCQQLGRQHYETTFFDAESSASVRGEKSTSYIESALAAQRIHALYPEAKILFLLREPLARAISNYRFSASNGLETLAIWEAFQREAERREQYDSARVSASPFAYLQRGRYIEYLELYEQVFARDAMHVMLHEDLIGGGPSIADLYRFLGVDSAFLPPGVDEIVNAAPAASSQLSPAQQETLRATFRQSNARLAARYALDLTPWD